MNLQNEGLAAGKSANCNIGGLWLRGFLVDPALRFWGLEWWVGVSFVKCAWKIVHAWLKVVLLDKFDRFWSINREHVFIITIRTDYSFKKSIYQYNSSN